MIRMEPDSSHIHRRVDSTPPQWKIRGWKIEFIRRKSSDKFDILITTPPPRCQKIRSVRALTRFLTDHGVAWPRAEDLGSLTPSKRSLCAGLEASPQPAAVGPGRVSVACLDGPGPPSPGTPPGFVTAPSGGPPAGGAEVQTGGACTAAPRRRRGAGRKGGPCVSPYFRRAGAGGGAPGRGRWQPPRSPFGLVQEELYHDPFQLLVATMLLNKTRGEAAVPVIWRLLARWPTAESLLGASEQDLAAVIRPLGLHRRRAHNIRRFAEEFLREGWSYPDELYGISKYGCDSYRIFCVEEWRDVRPTDHMLRQYVAWLEGRPPSA